MVWLSLLADLVLMVSQVSADAVYLLDYDFSCDSSLWRFNFTYTFNSSFEPWDEFGSYGYKVTCYNPSARACGEVVMKTGLTVKTSRNRIYPVNSDAFDKRNLKNESCHYNNTDLQRDTPYCSVEFDLHWIPLKVESEPSFCSDVHAMNMATPTDPVVVLSVSLSIILIFLFGIGLTALLVILILKCRRYFKLRANTICHLSLNYLDDFIKDIDPEKATIFNGTDYCNGDSNSEFQDSSTVKGDKTNVFDEEMSTDNEVKSLETNSSHVDTPSALNLTNIDIRKTKIDSTSSEADSGVVLGYVPIGSLQEKSDCLPK